MQECLSSARFSIMVMVPLMIFSLLIDISDKETLFPLSFLQYKGKLLAEYSL